MTRRPSEVGIERGLLLLPPPYCSQGGRVLLSKSAFKRMRPEEARDTCLVVNMGEHLQQNELLPATAIFQCEPERAALSLAS